MLILILAVAAVKSTAAERIAELLLAIPQFTLSAAWGIDSYRDYRQARSIYHNVGVVFGGLLAILPAAGGVTLIVVALRSPHMH
jgi:hypothetical protein